MNITIEVSSQSGSSRHQFDAPVITIGRHPSNDVTFPPDDERVVSAFHAKLVSDGGRVFLEDVGSRNGTWIRGQRIATRVQIQPDDEITLGMNGPRLRVMRRIPQTVAEIPGTIAQQIDVSGMMPLDPAGGAQYPADPGDGAPARSAVGSTTVMRLIDQALERSHEAPGGRLARQTVFIQEIVKLAVQQSNRNLRIALGALVVLLAAVFAFVFWRIAAVRSDVTAVRAELGTTIERGWNGVEQRLRATQRELEQNRTLYENAATGLQRQLDQTIAEAARRDSNVAGLAAQLAESRKRVAQLARDLETASLSADGGPAANREQIVTGLQQEQSRQRDLYQKLGQAAAAVPGAPDQAPVPEIGAQLMVADTSKAQLDARLDKLRSDLAAIGTNRAQGAQTASNAIAGGDTAVLLDTLSSIDRANAPKLASATPIAVDTAAPFVAKTSNTRYTKPFPRGTVKKRIAVGRFECLTPTNPWNVPPKDIERMLRAQMTTLLRDTGQFAVVDREDIAEVLEEQQLAGTGVAGRSGPAAGGIVGAQALLIGKITQLSDVVQTKKSSMNWGAMLGAVASAAGAAAPTSDFAAVTSDLAANPALGSLQTANQNRTSTFTIHIDFKILDTKTGEVLFSTPGHGVATSVTKVTAVSSFLGGSGSVIGGNDNVSDATRMALYDGVTKIMEGMEKLPWRGRIMDRTGDRLVVNGGEDAGLQVGDTFQVLSRGKELIDPDSGQSRGYIETPAGIVRITSVSPMRSEAEVLEQSLSFKPGDDLLYLGATRALAAGETEKEAAEQQPVRYAVISAPSAYSGPGTNYAPVKLAELEAGTPVRLKLMLGDWAKVLLPNNTTAWMLRSGLALREEPPTKVRDVVVQVKKAALRSMPSSRSQRVEVLPNGTISRVHEKLGDWYLVDSPKGVRGWIRAAEVRQNDAAPVQTTAAAGS